MTDPHPGGDHSMKITASCTLNGHDLTDIFGNALINNKLYA